MTAFFLVSDLLDYADIAELASHGFHAVVDCLILHFCINLGGLDVGVPQHLAYYLNGDVVGK